MNLSDLSTPNPNSSELVKKMGELYVYYTIGVTLCIYRRSTSGNRRYISPQEQLVFLLEIEQLAEVSPYHADWFRKMVLEQFSQDDPYPKCAYRAGEIPDLDRALANYAEFLLR